MSKLLKFRKMATGIPYYCEIRIQNTTNTKNEYVRKVSAQTNLSAQN
jgi:hypothetical protein